MAVRKESMMESINPLFNEISRSQVKISTTKPKTRAERSDKTKNVKFSVEHLFYMKLRTYCKQAGVYYERKYRKPLSQTKFNTLLLRHMLKNLDMVDWEIPYKDSKRYMHTNLRINEYKQLGGPYGIGISKGFSDRKVVYLMMKAGVEWLQRSGDIEKII